MPEAWVQNPKKSLCLSGLESSCVRCRQTFFPTPPDPSPSQASSLPHTTTHCSLSTDHSATSLAPSSVHLVTSLADLLKHDSGHFPPQIKIHHRLPFIFRTKLKRSSVAYRSLQNLTPACFNGLTSLRPSIPPPPSSQRELRFPTSSHPVMPLSTSSHGSPCARGALPVLSPWLTLIPPCPDDPPPGRLP